MNRFFEFVDTLNRRYFLYVNHDETLVKKLNDFRQFLISEMGVYTYELYERMVTDEYPLGRKGKFLFVYSDYSGMPYVHGIEWHDGTIEHGAF